MRQHQRLSVSIKGIDSIDIQADQEKAETVVITIDAHDGITEFRLEQVTPVHLAGLHAVLDELLCGDQFKALSEDVQEYLCAIGHKTLARTISQRRDEGNGHRISDYYL